MKKISTVLLAALLSGGMLLGMTACGNGNQNGSEGSAEQNAVSNPFSSVSELSGQTEKSDETASAVPQPSEQLPESSTEESRSQEENSPVQYSAIEEPSVSGDDDENSLAPEDSEDDGDVSITESGTDSSEISLSEEEDPDPTGTISKEFVGKWRMEYDYSQLTEEEASALKSYADGVSMTVVLNADGTAAAEEIFYDEKETFTGMWRANGKRVTIKIDGVNEEFELKDNKLYAVSLNAAYFVKE